MENRLAKALENGEFAITVEFIPGRGANEDSQEHELQIARDLAGNPRIAAYSITDNPSGNPALLADAFAEDIINETGMTPLVHLTCKDRNRNQIESQLYAMERRGIQNLLCMTGDYPVTGYTSRPRPVFDLDSVTLVQMITEMNKGMAYPGRKGEPVATKPCHFYPGVVTSPFKWTEGEGYTQYYKLDKKCRAGAKFIMSQIGFDPRKMEELLLVLKEQGHGNVPVFANIFVLPKGVGKSMNAGNFPGCYVSDELVAVLEEESKAEDKGKAKRFERAAKQIAVAKGLGYAGCHIGGIGLNAEAVMHVIELADEYEANWMDYIEELSFGMPGAWYMYEKDETTGLNKIAYDEKYHIYYPVRRPQAPADKRRVVQKNYALSRFVHKFMMNPGHGFYGVFSSIMARKDRKKGHHRKHTIENVGKVVLYGCMSCGDCGLPSVAYICPMTQCPKSQRNGPCGGSHCGYCEVFPNERLCVYYRAYHRLHKYGEEDKLIGYMVPPVNWDHFETSGWSNYVTGRDNISHREYLDKRWEHETPVPKK